MKAKDIIIGQPYVLARSTNSKPGMSMQYMDIFRDNILELIALENLLSYDNRNTVRVQGMCEIEGKHQAVSFWCSPFDLEKPGFVEPPKELEEEE